MMEQSDDSMVSGDERVPRYDGRNLAAEHMDHTIRMERAKLFLRVIEIVGKNTFNDEQIQAVIWPALGIEPDTAEPA